MIKIRRAGERGRSSHDWLDSFHTFSFADYYDPEFMGFRQLRVINEDYVDPGKGFDTHPHRNMEIITYVLEGKLQHKDNIGNGSIIGPGQIQRMSAGTGVLHSEFNPDEEEPVHLLQIWILPQEHGLQPSYEQKDIAFDGSGFQTIAARSPENGAVKVHNDVKLLLARLNAGQTAIYDLSHGRYAWVQVAKGLVALNSQQMQAGDGAAVSQEDSLTVTASQPSEVLLFDLS
jgi:redox-sensitive bicupin YhaK (pirin superfamily)